jgi:hypothetical protein
MNAYDASSPLANKVLNPDGSVRTLDGTLVAEPSAEGAAEYARRAPLANKMLNPDGSITELPSGGGGGGIPDAPADGKLYGRKDEAWDEVPSAVPLSGGTMTGILVVGDPPLNTFAARNISITDTDLTPGVSALPTGEVVLVYE